MIHFINLGEMIERIDEEIWDIINNHLPTPKVNILKILKDMDN